MEFSLNQFVKRMGQANYCVFKKWKKVWVAGFLEKQHHSIIRGQIQSKQLLAGLLHWEAVVGDCKDTFESWLPLDIIENSEWIRW